MIEGSYSKLFSSIITSTIWQEDDATRIVWITLLAMKNRFGEVAGSIPGLANLAKVTLPACEKALQKLQAPDKYSRSTENDGRRIEIIDGGWRVLNHGKYRDAMSEEKRRAYQAEWQRNYRARKKQPSVDTGVDTFTSRFKHADTDNTKPRSRNSRHTPGTQCLDHSCGACAKERMADLDDITP